MACANTPPMASGLQRTLTPDRIQLKQALSSKKRALELIASLFASASAELDQDAILEALATREKLGSTGLGDGIALPHCRVAACQQPLSCLVTLQEGIDFDARDDKPVTLLWALIVPAEENEQHLALLAEIAGILGDAEQKANIAGAVDSLTLRNNLFAEAGSPSQASAQSS